MRGFRIAVWLVGVVVGVGVAPGDGRAQSGFFKSSPGKLSQSHAHLDDQSRCDACHAGSKEVQDDRCLGCHEHKDLRDRIRAGKGYHALPRVRRYRCDNCHLEHRGRRFDIMGWDAVGGTDSIDHAAVGWKLVNKHADAKCSDCHKRHDKQGLRVYLGVKRECAGCHVDDQPHGFDRRGAIACDRCHTENGWKPPRRKLQFDHNAGGGPAMKLVGRHAELPCVRCHEKARFALGRQDPTNCAHCHDSPHRGQLFDRRPCGSCHSPKRKRMADVTFSHKPPRADFRLTGAHRKLKCARCHGERGQQRPGRSCAAAGCHRGASPHGDRFDHLGRAASDCSSCHTTKGWRPVSFRHGKNTGFELSGKHARIPCRDCHRGKRRPFSFERLDADERCTSCHAHQDAHGGEFRRATASAERAECLGCHQSVGSRALSAGASEHAHGITSSWPLTKAHKHLDCARCHPDGEFEDVSRQCDGCHQDSLHRGRLGRDCARCHMGGDWRAVRFDHGLKTKWPLVGAHREIDDCTRCHPQRQFVDTPTNCSAAQCHAADDVHKGKLGRDCGRCHRPTGELTFDHDRDTDFTLRGAHRRVECSKCHDSVRFEPRGRRCAECHQEPADHRGRYGKNCEGCHDESSFSDIRALHDAGDFELGGAHDGLQCTDCHVDQRPLRGTGDLCITCHRADDIHGNALSPRCGQCHTQWSWAPARFDHSSVGCTPIGLHRTLPCADCHRNGNYGAVSAQCYSCHRDEALRVSSPDHSGFQDCGSCHNTSYWSNGAGTGPAHGRESICW